MESKKREIIKKATDELKNISDLADESAVLNEFVKTVLEYALNSGTDVCSVVQNFFLEKRIMNRILHPEERSSEFYNSLSEEERDTFMDMVLDNYYGEVEFDDYETIEYAVNQAMMEFSVYTMEGEE